MKKNTITHYLKLALLKIYDKLFFKLFITIPQIANTEKTLKYILTHKCSVSRYGDGELNQCWKYSHIGFQNYNPLLSKRLKQILFNKNTNTNHIICIPYSYNNTTHMTKEAATFWNKVTLKHKLCIIPKLPKIQYFDSLCSRLYIDYKDKSRASYFFNLWKKIWDNQNILIVEGETTKLGVNNDLFSNVKSLKRIIVPNRNAFDVYDSILNTTIKHSTKKSLILLAIGPTATVLAYDLALHGYWAIDIGHIDIEYMWFQLKTTKKIPIPGKHVNETQSLGFKGGDEKYESSIITYVNLN